MKEMKAREYGWWTSYAYNEKSLAVALSEWGEVVEGR
jgi:hypothetical protein